MRKFGRIADRGTLEGAIANPDHIAIDADLFVELAMNRIILKQVSIGFDRAQIIDRDDFNVFAVMFNNRAKDQTTDTAKAINCNANSHGEPL
eukprot:CAMPEP_0195331826 /NCGR_PEP_ID=MMETSP0708-20121125/12884_1 /TAXON_ID=33640 /ORGANISM="Asterionellopsis glacialis, Strain CCMP134" /LENGTH=91 /DNA_ID=CAMNT_0040400409 /DNA_START=225 /DNA_END=497 /DNA_ORIENTATION=-